MQRFVTFLYLGDYNTPWPQPRLASELRCVDHYVAEAVAAVLVAEPEPVLEPEPVPEPETVLELEPE